MLGGLAEALKKESLCLSNNFIDRSCEINISRIEQLQSGSIPVSYLNGFSLERENAVRTSFFGVTQAKGKRIGSLPDLILATIRME